MNDVAKIVSIPHVCFQFSLMPNLPGGFSILNACGLTVLTTPSEVDASKGIALRARGRRPRKAPYLAPGTRSFASDWGCQCYCCIRLVFLMDANCCVLYSVDVPLWSM